MKRIITILACLAAGLCAAGQNDWAALEKLINQGSYKSAYNAAEARYNAPSATGRTRLTAAWYMARAEAMYQYDAADSAEARYRALLPELDSLSRSLCYAFLGQFDSALLCHQLLQRTPVSSIKEFCSQTGTGTNLTPTAYDMLVVMLQNSGTINAQQRVQWQRTLCQFHQHDADDIRILHCSRLIEMLADVPNHPLHLATVQQAIDQYRGSRSQHLALLYWHAAQRCMVEGDYVAAVHYCDTAVSLFPKSQGGVECANIRANVQHPRLSLDDGNLVVPPGQHNIQRIAYRNIGHAHLRVVAVTGNINDNNGRKRLVAAKPVWQTDVALPENDRYLYDTAIIALPPLETGEYTIMVSPGSKFNANDFYAYSLVVTDIMVLQDNAGGGLVLDRRTGLPVSGQSVSIKIGSPRTSGDVIKTVVTDAEGRFHTTVDQTRYNFYLVVQRGGVTISAPYRKQQPYRIDSTTHAIIRTDRPIYRPADTLHVATMLYNAAIDGGRVVADATVAVVLDDPNGNRVAADTLRTDTFGIAATYFVLPTNRMPGEYSITAHVAGRMITHAGCRVEEYKQPRFMVQLQSSSAETPAFGQSFTATGTANTYSGVPLSGAKVSYRVERTTLQPRWWYRPQGFYLGATTVAEGEATVAADGSFAIAFVPEPDSSVDLSARPAFRYTLYTDVTDLNGESHSASASFNVGYRNAFIVFDGHTAYVQDINGNRTATEVSMVVDRLQPPAQALHSNPYPGAKHTLDATQWQALFPNHAYDAGYNNPATWPVAKRMHSAAWQKQSGTYRITLAAQGADTLVEYQTITATDATTVQERRLFYADVDTTRVDVGHTVTLRYGSVYGGIRLYYRLCVADKVRAFAQMPAQQGRLHALTIAVDSAMLGGFDVELLAVKDNEFLQWRKHIDVPYTHKRLDVDIATFRDHLQPGQHEQWTITVHGRQQHNVGSAALLLTMYDQALDSYGGAANWGFDPWHYNREAYMSAVYMYAQRANWLKDSKWEYYSGAYPTTWQLQPGVWRGRGRYGHIMYKSANAAPRSASVYETLVEEEEEVFSADLSVVAGLGYDGDAVVATSMLADADAAPMASSSANDAPVQVRSNLGSLAFFAANVRTDSTGTATYSFVVPELLTRWSMHGFAVTPTLCNGSVQRTLTTSKPLMVQPNMPRFLRAGDVLVLAAKIVRAADECAAQSIADVQATLLLTDALTGDTICHLQQIVCVTDVAQVLFPVAVPSGVHVITYTITAETTGASDGERGQLPVCSRREAVSISRAVYINGVGEKRFALDEYPGTSPTRQPLLVAAEYTSNPIWLAVKAMPYVADLQNPSTLYLANQLYVNTLGSQLLRQVRASHLLADTAGLRLSLNADVKQQALEATPWLRAAEQEQEQRLAMAVYFDSTHIDSLLRATQAQLVERQNPDGGYNWLPEGRSNVWVTQQVLKRLNSPTMEYRRALAFVDNEKQAYYAKHIKPYLGKKKHTYQPTDIDYLYMRSIYGKASTEAYKFYYNNALQNYRNTNNLYTQAQLALVFARGGDRRQALDLLRRLKEKALESDEQGVYWRDNLGGSYLWYNRPIETQALLIQAFAEITPADSLFVGKMQQWLLKQKQTTHWGNDRATVDAIAALLQGGGATPAVDGTTLVVFGDTMQAPAERAEGYAAQRWTGTDLDALVSQRNNTITFAKTNPGIAWGAVYYMYTDDAEQIPSTTSGITLRRTYNFDAPEPHVGNRMTVRIEITCDRAMDYLELVDPRPSCTEPLSTQARWIYSGGLSCYVVVGNADTKFYIEHLDKGKYVVEYEVYLTNAGRFVASPARMQCMYAPEFRANTTAETLYVGQ